VVKAVSTYNKSTKELNCSGLSVAAAAPIGLAAFNINGN